eukprot:15845751-Heterocapsa_arctica.AAC.1
MPMWSKMKLCGVGRKPHSSRIGAGSSTSSFCPGTSLKRIGGKSMPPATRCTVTSTSTRTGS